MAAVRAAGPGQGDPEHPVDPLTWNGTTVGALNVYSRHEAAFAEHETRWADQFAAEAAKVVRTATDAESGQRLRDQVRDALDSRDAIARAEGLLMERDGLTAAVARATLRTRSRVTRTPLRTLSEDMLTTVSSTSTPPTSGGSAHEGPAR